SLLSQAVTLAEEQRYQSGDGVDAVSRYRAVLALAPENEAATEGLRTISGIYLREAKRAGDRGDVHAARLMLGQAKDTWPGHEDYAATAAYLLSSELQGPGVLKANEIVATAHDALKDGETARALAAFRKALTVSDGHDGALKGILAVRRQFFDVISHHLDQGSLDSARSVHAEAIQAFPQDSQLLSLSQTIDNVVAKHEQQVVTQREIDSLLLSAEAHVKNKTFITQSGDNALELFYEVLARDPSNKVAQHWVDKIRRNTHEDIQRLIDEGQYSEARTLFELAVGKLSEDQVLTQFGEALDNAEQDQRVRSLLKQGQELMAQGRAFDPSARDALSYFLGVLAVRPDQPEAIAAVDTIRLSVISKLEADLLANRLDEARRFYSRARQLPKTPSLDAIGEEIIVRSSLAQAQKQHTPERVLGGDHSALALYRKVLALRPGHAAAKEGEQRAIVEFQSRIATMIADERFDAAQKLVSDALSAFPKERMLHRYQVEISEAQQSADRDAQIRELLAKSQSIPYEIDAFSAEAIAVAGYYRKVLALDPNNATARTKLDALSLALQKTLRARLERDELNTAGELLRSVEVHFNEDPKVRVLAAAVNRKLRERADTIRADAYVARALAHMEHDRLTAPENDNAFVNFTRALKLSPKHAGAKNGLKKIVERYLVLSDRARSRAHFPQALALLKRAERVAPTDKRISLARAKVVQTAHTRNIASADVPPTVAAADREPGQGKFVSATQRKISRILRADLEEPLEDRPITETLATMGKRLVAELSSLTPLEERIARTLRRGEYYLRSGRLVSASTDNAMTQFQDVLEIAPEQPGAKRGLIMTIEQLVYRVEQLLANKKFAEAERLQRLAENILHNDAPFVILNERIEEAKATLAARTPHGRKRLYPDTEPSLDD
ncbi:MAG: hypothetical protein K0U93_09825, partial [Gammaproteobacteria bacterium]|nr:hypothetical protein [Gammaproteobacteria bacterium]